MDENKKYILKEIEILDNSKTKKYKIKYSNEYYITILNIFYHIFIKTIHILFHIQMEFLNSLYVYLF